MSPRHRTPTEKDPHWRVTPPSSTLLRFVHQFAPNRHPVLDAGCGFGRNALALALRGLHVVAADRDPMRLSAFVNLTPSYFARFAPNSTVGEINALCTNLAPSTWPFRRNAFSGITCIHFPDHHLLNAFRFSLRRNGLLYMEPLVGTVRTISICHEPASSEMQ